MHACMHAFIRFVGVFLLLFFVCFIYLSWHLLAVAAATAVLEAFCCSLHAQLLLLPFSSILPLQLACAAAFFTFFVYLKCSSLRCLLVHATHVCMHASNAYKQGKHGRKQCMHACANAYLHAKMHACVYACCRIAVSAAGS